MFITTKVFDPKLEGQAVKLSGSLIEGNFIVTKVHSYNIEVIGASTKATIPMSDFEHGAVVMEYLEPKNTDIPKITTRKPIKRNVGTHSNRTKYARALDNKILERILRENVRPMRLGDIIDRMHENTRTHWNKNNASSYMRKAIKDGCKVFKSEYGIYSYKFEGVKENGHIGDSGTQN